MDPRPNGVSPPADPLDPPTSSDDQEFFPKGAIAFFVSMLIGFGVIWMGLYLLMLDRQFRL
jgi:hypothetical protein